MEEWIKIVGGCAGLAALAWRAFDEFRAFLRLSVSVSTEDGAWVMITTSVENRGARAKKISRALLLIGPEGESPVLTANSLSEPTQFRFTNDFKRLQPALEPDRAAILIPFYFMENVDIADETLGYTVPVARNLFRPGVPYAVRFFIFGPYHLHRSTQACFLIPTVEPGNASA
jgi:hypothetical protein